MFVLTFLFLAGPPTALALQAPAPSDPTSGYSSRIWNTGNGLPINEIWGIAQTPDGYLWLATFGGLVRFDGRRFQVYSSSEYPELPSDRIREIRLRPDGSLLLLTELGQLVAFDGTDFTPLVPGPVSAGLVSGMWEDAAGQVWLGIDGKDFGRLQDDRFVPALENPPGWRVVRSVQIDSTIWVATREGRIFSVGPSGVSDETPDAGGGRPPWKEIIDIALGPDRRIYVGTPEGLFRLDRSPHRMERLSGESVAAFSTSPDRTTLISQSSDGVRVGADGVPHPVIGSRRGRPALPVLEQSDGTFWHVEGTTLFRNGEPVAEVSGLVHEIFVDAEGSTWLASQGGLVQVSPNVFASYQPTPAELRAACREMVCVPKFAVYAIAEQPDSSLLIGTLDFGTWSLGVRGGLKRVSVVPAFSLLTGEGEAWLGTFGGGVCRVGPPNCVHPEGTEDSDGAIVRAMARGDHGETWIGTDQGVLRILDGRTTRFGPAQGVPAAQVVSVIPTPDGAWVGTFGGLARISGGRAEVLRESDGLSSNVIRSMHLTDDGVLWVGTEARGLNRVAVAGKTLADVSITRYTKRDGLLADGIHTILDDGLGRLWMSSNDGIFWVRRTELEAFARGETTQVHSVAYLERDGLADREANGGTESAGLRGADGRLWFATMGGAAVVDPSTVTPQNRRLSVLIESTSSGNETYGHADTVVLRPGNRNLQVEYTAPAFRGAESLRFRYRMEGYDEDWVAVGTRRTAFYTNLPPGRLTFRVAAAGSDGVWYEAADPLRISVIPLFYERAWFFPLLLAAILGLATLLVVRRQSGLQAQASALSRLVAERTAQLEREKEESKQAQRTAEEAEARVKEALDVVAAQAQRLQELDEAKSRIFANISHELRTPLTLTIGPLEDLRDELEGRVEDDTIRGVDIALGNSRRLLRLVNQLLDVAKLEYGRLEIHPVMLDLAELMRVVVEAFGPLAERRGVRLETEGLEMLHATVDGDALEKILLNLLSNALKATGQGKSVGLCLERVEDRARIVVQDEGSGIAPDILPRIFDRFYQGAPPAHHQVRGSGIGLALVRELVELHGGTIGVASEIGVGTRFTIDLPLVAESRSEEVGERPRRRPDVSGLDEDVTPDASGGPDWGEEASDSGVEDHRTTVLLVDDNADVRAYVRKHLSKTYRVVEAEDGRRALELAEEAPPDLVLADVMMPGMNGEELCRRIKTHPDLEFVPVVLLTAKASSESRVRALELGADDHLSKPFDKDELRARIANLIDRSHRLRDRLRGVQIVARGVELGEVSSDERFLANVRSVVLERMDDENFGVEELATALGQSRAHFYRRLGELHHQSPAELIKILRLQRAAELLRAGEGSVSEVAYAVGFKSVSHFSRSFRDAYGATPSRFARSEVGGA